MDCVALFMEFADSVGSRSKRKEGCIVREMWHPEGPTCDTHPEPLGAPTCSNRTLSTENDSTSSAKAIVTREDGVLRPQTRKLVSPFTTRSPVQPPAHGPFSASKDPLTNGSYLLPIHKPGANHTTRVRSDSECSRDIQDVPNHGAVASHWNCTSESSWEVARAALVAPTGERVPVLSEPRLAQETTYVSGSAPFSSLHSDSLHQPPLHPQASTFTFFPISGIDTSPHSMSFAQAAFQIQATPPVFQQHAPYAPTIPLVALNPLSNPSDASIMLLQQQQLQLQLQRSLLEQQQRALASVAGHELWRPYPWFSVPLAHIAGPQMIDLEAYRRIVSMAGDGILPVASNEQILSQLASSNHQQQQQQQFLHQHPHHRFGQHTPSAATTAAAPSTLTTSVLPPMGSKPQMMLGQTVPMTLMSDSSMLLVPAQAVAPTASVKNQVQEGGGEQTAAAATLFDLLQIQASSSGPSTPPSLPGSSAFCPSLARSPNASMINSIPSPHTQTGSSDTSKAYTVAPQAALASSFLDPIPASNLAQSPTQLHHSLHTPLGSHHSPSFYNQSKSDSVNATPAAPNSGLQFFIKQLDFASLSSPHACLTFPQSSSRTSSSPSPSTTTSTSTSLSLPSGSHLTGDNLVCDAYWRHPSQAGSPSTLTLHKAHAKSSKASPKSAPSAFRGAGDRSESRNSKSSRNLNDLSRSSPARPSSLFTSTSSPSFGHSNSFSRHADTLASTPRDPEAPSMTFAFKPKAHPVSLDSLITQNSSANSSSTNSSSSSSQTSTMEDTLAVGDWLCDSSNINSSLHATRLSTLQEEGIEWSETSCDTTGQFPDGALPNRNPADWLHSWQLNRRVISRWLLQAQHSSSPCHDSVKVDDMIFDLCRFYASDFDGSFFDFIVYHCRSRQEVQAKLADYRAAANSFCRLIEETKTENTGSSPTVLHIATSYFNCSSRKRETTTCGAKLNARLWYNMETKQFVESVEGAKKNNLKNTHAPNCCAIHKSRLTPSINTIRLVDRLLASGLSPSAVEQEVREHAKSNGSSEDGRSVARLSSILTRQRLNFPNMAVAHSGTNTQMEKSTSQNSSKSFTIHIAPLSPVSMQLSTDETENSTTAGEEVDQDHSMHETWITSSESEPSPHGASSHSPRSTKMESVEPMNKKRYALEEAEGAPKHKITRLF